MRKSVLFSVIFSLTVFTGAGCGEKSCPHGVIPSAKPAQGSKFVLSLFHFNIQYIAGGLTGEGGDTISNEIMEDLIIRESFEPVVDFYLNHPGWKTNIELQGYMLEVLKQRHRDVLEKLRTLVERGQVELMSFHYSDQLYLAFPREDMEKSWEINMKISKDVCLPFGGAVFTQEGQFGPGTFNFMHEKGYTVSAFPRGLFRYHFSGGEVKPLYVRDGVYIIIAPEDLDFELEGTSYSLRWVYYDDGELLATGGVPPYFIISFKGRQEYLRNYEKKIQNYEARGYTTATISEYVNTLLSRGAQPEEFPVTFDGDWRPGDSDNLFLWTGGRGLFGSTEMDNAVRVDNWKTRYELIKAEKLIESAESQGIPTGELRKKLEEGWKHQLKAEVSDSTGWNPFYTEVKYSLFHSGEAEKIAREIISEFQDIPLPDLAPDLPDTCTRDEDFTQPATFPLQVTVETGRSFTTSVLKCTSDSTIKKLIIDLSPGEDRMVSVTFPFTLTYVTTTPALLEDVPHTYYFQNYSLNHVCIAPPSGIIKVDEKTSLVQDHFTVHLSYCIYPEEHHIVVKDETAPTSSFNWQFYLVEKSFEESLKHALRWNLYPLNR